MWCKHARSGNAHPFAFPPAFLLLALTVVSALALPNAHGAARRVRLGAPGPVHDGATWDQAFLSVQSAINASAAGDEVWVAAGNYQERITVKAGVALYGGFAGGEAARGQRDFARNATVLDGAAAGPVVTFVTGAMEETRLDGFTIINGKAINGGGIVCTAASPTIANNNIKGNISTGWGGGISCYGLSSPTITGNSFTGNYAGGVFGDGGAIMCIRSSSPIIAGNVFRGNIAAQNGGAIAMFHDSSPTILGNLFRGNISYTLSIASTGGYTNRAAIGGGAIFGTAADEDYRPVENARCEPVIANNVVAANGGDAKSGGICLVDAILGGGLVANNTVISNSGAGISWGNTAPRIVNNIVAYNQSGLRLYSGQGTTAIIRNNCLFRNDMLFQPGDYMDLPDLNGVDGNMTADPQIASFACGNGHIQPGSPCIGAGDPTVPRAGWTDIDGQARVQGVVDIGADESDGTTWNVKLARAYVRPDGSDANSGATWALAKKTLQAAMDAVDLVGGEVWVQQGTYNERIILRPYVYLFGGFKGTETELAQRNANDNVTTLDGGQNGIVVTAQGGYQVSRLEGFVIRNGRGADDGGGVWVNVGGPVIAGNAIVDNQAVNDGGGIAIYSGFPIVYGNYIGRNRCLESIGGQGGGIYAVFSSPVIWGNEIAENKGMDGTGVKAEFSGPALLENYIHDNATAAYIGEANAGAVSLVDSNVMMLRNAIIGNKAQSGGGIYMSAVGGRIADNVLISNVATMNGGGLMLYYARGALSIENNTIAGNVCDGDMWHEWGGAMCLNGLFVDSVAPVIVNNIIAYNSSGIFHNAGSSGLKPVPRNNCVWQNVGGGLDFDYEGLPDPTGQNGNIRADPRFVALNPADLHLQTGSPCIDAGDNAPLRMGDASWDGMPRLLGANVDIGACEAGTPSPYTVADVRRALEILGGRAAPTLADAFRLNIVPGNPLPDSLDMQDAVALARRVAGLQ